MSIDIFSIFAEDKRMVLYRPEWRKFTGSVTATILLQQIIFHWNQHGRKPFYKFKEPCGHNLYKSGDSWCEELGFSRKEFDSAMKRIGCKRSKKQHGSHDAPVEYWTDARRLTYFAIREDRLAALLTELYIVKNTNTSRPETPEERATDGKSVPRDDESSANVQKGLYVNPERDLRKIPKGTLDLNPERDLRKSPKGDFPNKEDQRDPSEKKITAEREDSPALALFFEHFPDILLPEIARQEIVETVNNSDAWKYTIWYWQIKGYQAQYTANMIDFYRNKALPRFSEAAIDKLPTPSKTPILDFEDLPAIEAALKERLAARINPPSFNTWLRPLRVIACDRKQIVFHAPDETFVFWLEEHYLPLLNETCAEQLGCQPAIRVTVNGGDLEGAHHLGAKGGE